MKNQYSSGFSLIHWVKHDAQFIVEQLRDTTTPSTRRSGS
jgi:hypothetical protein